MVSHTRMKAVLDTNVLISAYVFPGGKPETVYRLALEGRLEIGTSLTLLAEFGRVLGQKFGWVPDQVEAAVAQVARIARGRSSRARRSMSSRPTRQTTVFSRPLAPLAPT